MRRILLSSFILLFVCLNPLDGFSQSSEDSLKAKKISKEDKNLTFFISEDKSRYFRITFLNQVWLRYNQSNDGTTVIGKAQPETIDIGLRRTRIQMYGQVLPRVFLYFQFGQNNFNSMFNVGGNRKNAAFFHDALGEYRVSKKEQFVLGGGLTITNGLSRFSQPSVGTIMTQDVPVFAQATVDQTDEFSRKLSVYARGQVGKLDYRLILSDPFPITSNGAALPALNENATFSQRGHTKQFQGLLVYNFFDAEAHTTPYMTGTYLGKKKVWNVALGAISQSEAMWRKQGADTVYQNILLWCVESFLDMPLGASKKNVISAYLGYFNYDFGQNYLRYNGLMNPANGTANPSALKNHGPTYGNAFPMFGTGNVIYAQLGYWFRPKQIKSASAFMPYLTCMSADYERLQNQRMTVWSTGINWLIDGHKAKLTLEYQNRPTYSEQSGTIRSDKRKNALVLQYQIFI